MRRRSTSCALAAAIKRSSFESTTKGYATVTERIPLLMKTSASSTFEEVIPTAPGVYLLPGEFDTLVGFDVWTDIDATSIADALNQLDVGLYSLLIQ